MRNEDAFNLNAKKINKRKQEKWPSVVADHGSVLHLIIIFSGERYFTFRHICNFDSRRHRSRAVERLLAIYHLCPSVAAAAGHSFVSQNCAETCYCWCCCCRYSRNTGHGLHAANYVVAFIVRKQHNNENGHNKKQEENCLMIWLKR